MKIIGYLFIVVGFLGGAFTTVLETEQVYWEGFVVAVIAGVAGVVMVRLVISRAARKEETLTVNIRNLLESLSRVVDNITALNQEKESINPYDFRHRIDELFPVDLATFVDAREAISHLRRASRRPETAMDPADIGRMAESGAAAQRSDPRQALDTAQRRRLVEESLGELSPQQRAVFILRFREDMTPREIAESLGLPPRQVRSQLHRAIARLRDMLREEKR